MPGQSGGRKSVLLELKLIADVGLVGFPNVSTKARSSYSASLSLLCSLSFCVLYPSLFLHTLSCLTFNLAYCHSSLPSHSSLLTASLPPSMPPSLILNSYLTALTPNRSNLPSPPSSFPPYISSSIPSNPYNISFSPLPTPFSIPSNLYNILCRRANPLY
jgi:hypothetical protein